MKTNENDLSDSGADTGEDGVGEALKTRHPPGGRGSEKSESECGESIEAQTIFAQRGPVSEAALVEEWGISRETLRDARHLHLREGVGWEKKGRDIVILPAGLTQLAAVFEIAEKNSPEKKEGDAAAAAVAPWYVVQVPRNPKLVLLAPERGKPPTARLRVRDNSKFTIGMDCTGKVRLISPEQPDFWELSGNQPRFRGRW